MLSVRLMKKHAVMFPDHIEMICHNTMPLVFGINLKIGLGTVNIAATLKSGKGSFVFTRIFCQAASTSAVRDTGWLKRQYVGGPVRIVAIPVLWFADLNYSNFPGK